MSENIEPQTIIKIKDVDEKYRKKLGDDKIFKFECETINEKLRIGLKEINAYSPYYYEAFFTKDELDEKNDIFRALKTLDKIKEQLSKLFSKRSTLKNGEDDEKIILTFEIPSFDEKEIINFDLEKKTIEEKDKALLFLFDIEKKNINILNRIKEQCLKNPKEPACQKILELLNNKN